MIRTRALAAIGIVLAGAVVLPAASLPENSPSAAAAAHRAAFDQQSVWQTESLLRHLPFRSQGTGRTEPGDPWTSPISTTMAPTWEKILRKLRNREMPPAGMPRPDEATYRGPRQVDRKRTRSRGAGQAQSRHAPRSIASTGRNTPMRFAICWRWRLTFQSCCRPTTSATASTISATCCRYRPCCWNAILSAAQQDQPAGRGRYHDACILSDLRHSARAHSGRSYERRPAGRLARRHRHSTISFRWTANMRFRSTCKEAETMSIWAWSGSASSI